MAGYTIVGRSEFAVILASLAISVPFVVGSSPSVADDATRVKELRQRIEELDADTFATRERATRALQKAGVAAEDLLLEALKSPSPEVRRRAEFILRDGHWRRLHGEISEFAALPDEKIDVEHGMWLIARILDPSVKERDLQRQLNQLADKVRERLPLDVAPRKLEPRFVMEAIRDVLFQELKFHGATTNYQDPQNSSLARVLRRKEGLPILLSHVVIGVGNRLGLPLEGVATPGRYLVRYDAERAPEGAETEDIIMDAFDGGKLLSESDLVAMFPGIATVDLQEIPRSRQILVRMLNNLETHLYHVGDSPRAEMALAFRSLLSEYGDDF